ncbi:flavodoxin family protein [Levilactobacillus yonginensis]|uniref:flavodoxin family protein n=1 Tax=Levilactobacillus yonginensis TaxID=1054041 RepID=UPI00345CB277
MGLNNRVKNRSAGSANEKIAGQPITAYQLGKSAGAWRNGAGTESDGQDTNSQNRPTRHLTKTARSLIIYFSRSGSTELLASKIAKQTSADLLEIVVERPYAASYPQTLSRANLERESANFPELNLQVPDLSRYETIYLGYPIWAMTLAHPMTAFLMANGRQLTHKQIAPFMTEGGYGQGNSVERIQDILENQGSQKNRFVPALVVDGNQVDQADKRVAAWVAQVQSGD